MKLDDYYRELNEIMESDASKNKLTLKRPVERRKTSPSHFIAAAAALLIVPFLSIYAYSYFSYRSLIRDENRAFLNDLIDKPLTQNEETGDGFFDESDWFDVSTPPPLL